MNKVTLVLTIGIVFSSCNGPSDVDNNGALVAPPPAISFSVVDSYPHDTGSFIQGLAFYDGQLYESTGSPDNVPNNGSWMGPIDIATGKPAKKVPLDKKYFGEGITILHDKIYQITWQQKKGFVYNVRTLKKLKEFSYKTEGWGLTNDGTHVIMSDGSSNLYFFHPDSLTVVKTLGVSDNSGPVANINELEYINGFIYANQWGTPYILKIDLSAGKVVGRLDLSNIVAQAKNKNPNAEVLNGIAYDSTNNRIYVTGKKWPVIYGIKLL